MVILMQEPYERYDINTTEVDTDKERRVEPKEPVVKLHFKPEGKKLVGEYNTLPVELCTSPACEHRCRERREDIRTIRTKLGYRPRVKLTPWYEKGVKTKHIAHLWPPKWLPKAKIRVPRLRQITIAEKPTVLERLTRRQKRAQRKVWKQVGWREVDPISIINLSTQVVGASATAYCNERTGKIIIVDWGMSVPTRDPVLDPDGRTQIRITKKMLPYVDFLKNHLDDIEAIIVTHVHADHAWGITWLEEKYFGIPVYVTRFVKIVLTEMIRQEKGEDARLPNFVEFTPSYNGKAMKIGDAHVIAFPVNHSTLEACALFFNWGGRRILHLADFKLTAYTDRSKDSFLVFLTKLTRKPMDILSIDAVGAYNKGMTPPEQRVIQATYEIIKQAKGRVILVVFSTNLVRIEEIAKQASRAGLGRWTSFWGRSMERMVRLATENGLIELPEWTGSAEESQKPSSQLLIATGSQAEPGSQLVRAADGAEINGVRIQQGDTVIISARPIPGNEDDVKLMEAKLRLRGADVYTVEEVPDVHVSGHGAEEDLRITLRITRPVLINGLHAHKAGFEALKRIAAEVVPDAEVFRLRTGKRYEVYPAEFRLHNKAS